MPALLPELDGRQLTVDVALNTPTILRNRIAKLTDEQILLDKLFHGYGAQVEGGGILYSVVQASDFYLATDVEQRSPGSEYKVVEGVDPDPRLALVSDWGGKFQVFEEHVLRNNVSYLDQQTTQLANTIARKLDTASIAAVEAALLDDETNTVAGHSWDGLTFVGPLDAITASAERPTADFSAAQLASDLQELGVKHDLLIVHPNQAAALRTAYAENLNDMLASAGLSMFANPRMAPGNAYVCEKGQVGTIGFEQPLTVTTWPEPATRSIWVQGFCVPALAVDRPFSLKKLTGLAAA
ncbi:major capsid protein [Mycobacterium sherrisii]|uniref:major capsid protein n=1 Tax=Mycobacterium sherrisii TaxID=243061 RepID=UPI002DDCA8EC|nr:major capsid protein [Mycobacterium sherrisii]MEC4763364.1 major capsid protein [Mycobacterium sherrisii]